MFLGSFPGRAGVNCCINQYIVSPQLLTNQNAEKQTAKNNQLFISKTNIERRLQKSPNIAASPQTKAPYGKKAQLKP